MPVHASGGGFKYGKTGKLYKGAGAKKKAIKQAVAIKYSEARAAGKKKPDMSKGLLE